MCGRFTLAIDFDSIIKHFELENDAVINEFKASYNISPGQNILVLTSKTGKYDLNLFKWGLVPFYAKSASDGYKMINARAETLKEKPTFRNLLKNNRCLIIADGFYEWKKENKEKIPYYFKLKDRNIFTFAGLWSRWVSQKNEIVDSCTIITTKPNSIMENIHNRMPVILSEEDQHKWLDKNLDDDRLNEIFKPFPSDKMYAYKVSDYVNSTKNDGDKCVKAI